MDERELSELTGHVLEGGEAKYHQKNAEQGKLFARERIARLLDADSFVEDAQLANAEAEGLPSDGVITGVKLGTQTAGQLAAEIDRAAPVTGGGQEQ